MIFWYVSTFFKLPFRERTVFIFRRSAHLLLSWSGQKKWNGPQKKNFSFVFFLHLVVKCQLLILLTEVVAVNWSSPDAVEIKASSVPAFVKSFQNWPRLTGWWPKEAGFCPLPTQPGSKLNKSLILKIPNSSLTDKGWLEGGWGGLWSISVQCNSGRGRPS